jgi:hypothetical protein
MYAFRCLRCGCLHGWFDHPAVLRVRRERREPIRAGSLPPGTTGVNVAWECPGCGAEHVDAYGERPVASPSPAEVRVRAYYLWEAAGRPPGDGVRFWLAAEQELRHAPTFEMVRCDDRR